MPRYRGLTRRSFLAAAAAAAGAACAPAAAPAPAAPPAAPRETAPATRAAWEQEWDALVAAAKREGQISVITMPGTGYRQFLDGFEKAFPGVVAEHQSFASSGLLIPKVTQERTAGVYSYDVALFTIGSVLATLAPTGAFDPVRPAIIRPDITEDKNWRFGYEFGFMDNARRLVYASTGNVSGHTYINTDVVRESDLKSVRDLLDPRWRGRIGLPDVRSGDTFAAMLAVRTNLGETAVKQLIIDQQPVFRRTAGEVAEDLVRGRYPIAGGLLDTPLSEFRGQGLGQNIKKIELPESLYVSTSGGAWLFNRAPHLNAAKLFINWSLTKAGQELLAKATIQNSLRSDVAPVDASLVPDPNKRYTWNSREDMGGPLNDIRKYLEDLVK